MENVIFYNRFGSEHTIPQNYSINHLKQIITLASIFIFPTKFCQYHHHFVQIPFLLTALRGLRYTNRETTNIQKVVRPTAPYFTCIYITFLISKTFFKTNGKPNCCFRQQFLNIKQIIFLLSQFNITLILYFYLLVNHKKSVETTKNFLQI